MLYPIELGVQVSLNSLDLVRIIHRGVEQASSLLLGQHRQVLGQHSSRMGARTPSYVYSHSITQLGHYRIILPRAIRR